MFYIFLSILDRHHISAPEFAVFVHTSIGSLITWLLIWFVVYRYIEAIY